MAQIDTDLLAFKEYQQKLQNYPLTTVVGSLLYRIVTNGVPGGGGSGGTVTGGSTAAKQDELIARLNSLLAENATEANQDAIEALVSSFLSENATEAKQDEIRDEITAIKDAIAPAIRPSPVLEIATASGSIPAGAKFASFTIPAGSTGSIQGTTLTPDVEVVDFPLMPGGYAAIAYTITSGTFIITYAIQFVVRS